MTVAVQDTTIAYIEDGVTLAFPVPFRYRSPSDLVAQRELVDGSIITLVNGTDFSASAGDSDAGGTLTLLTGSVATAKLRVWRETPRKQQAQYETTGDFSSKSHEAALDESALRDQEIDRELERVVKVPRGLTPPDLDLSGLLDGDILQFIGGELRRVDRSVFAGKFYAGDATGRMVPAGGVGGADANLRSDMADPAVGPALLSDIRRDATARRRTHAEVLQARPFTLDEYYRPDLGDTDHTNALARLVTAVNAYSGKARIIMEPTAVPYEATAGAVFDHPDLHVQCFGAWRQVGLTPFTLFKFTGPRYLAKDAMNQKLVLELFADLRGNGDTATYTYTTSNQHRMIEIENIRKVDLIGRSRPRVSYGTVENIALTRCIKTLCEGFDLFGALHDNNLTHLRFPDCYDAADPATLPEHTVRRITSSGARDNGFTVYDCPNVTYDQIASRGNGTDALVKQTLVSDGAGGLTYGVEGASGGGISVEGDTDVELNTRIFNSEVVENLNGGISAQVGTTLVANSTIEGVLSSLPKATYRDSGAALTSYARNGDVTLEVRDCKLGKCTGPGVAGVSTTVGGVKKYPSVVITGRTTISHTGREWYHMLACAKLVVGPQCEFSYSNDTANADVLGSFADQRGSTWPGDEVVNNNSDFNATADVRVEGKRVFPGIGIGFIRSAPTTAIVNTEVVGLPSGRAGQYYWSVEGSTAISLARIQNNRIRGSVGIPANAARVTGTITTVEHGGNSGDQTGNFVTMSGAAVTNKKGFTPIAIPDAAGWADAPAQAKYNADLAALRAEGAING